MLPPRIQRPEGRHCLQCSTPLSRRDGEESRDFARREYCGKSCAIAGRAGYVTRSENLLQNSACADERGCWNWTGYRDKKGYGRTIDRSGEVLAHRLSYMEFVGPIPAGLHILHSCDNPRCINPSHLRAGTNDENMADRLERDRCWKPKGEANPKAKLTADCVFAIRSSGLPTSTLAEQYMVSRSTIRQIKAKRIWGHV